MANIIAYCYRYLWMNKNNSWHAGKLDNVWWSDESCHYYLVQIHHMAAGLREFAPSRTCIVMIFLSQEDLGMHQIRAGADCRQDLIFERLIKSMFCIIQSLTWRSQDILIQHGTTQFISRFCKLLLKIRRKRYHGCIFGQECLSWIIDNNWVFPVTIF